MSEDLKLRVEACINDYNIPGMTLAVWHRGEMQTATGGVLNLNTGHPVVEDSPFPIGSITKVFTATLLMQLVEQGRAELDAPLSTYLPGFRTATPGAVETMTLRHLLSHSSGLDGDYFVGSGTGEDAIRRYMDMCRLLPNLFEPGAMHSYSNSGFTILGEVVRAISGRRWDELMQDNIFQPLGLDRAAVHAEDMLLHGGAVGHVAEPDGEGGVRNRAVGPMRAFKAQMAAGSYPSMSMRNLARFAQAHLGVDGVPPLVKPESLAMMRQRQIGVDIPAMQVSGWGIGWSLGEASDGQLLHFGHDGGVAGAGATLTVVPGADLIVCAAANGGNMAGMRDALVNPLLTELGGLEFAAAPTEKDVIELDAERLRACLGRYSNVAQGLEVSVGEDGQSLLLTITPGVSDMPGMAMADVVARPVSQSGFIASVPGMPTPMQFDFLGDGAPGYVRMGARLMKRR